MEGVPVSGPFVKKLMFGDAAQFTESEGQKWRFCKRYGIKNLVCSGEKLSGDRGLSKPWNLE